MRVLLLLIVCLVIGIVIIYFVDGRKEDVFGYGFWDYVGDLFKRPLKEVLVTFVISIILGLLCFGVLCLFPRCSDDDDKPYDDERGLRLHTDLIEKANLNEIYGRKALENTFYCELVFNYRSV